jgi:hypothetical protein
MEALIHMLTILIKIGKYLPLIVFTFATVNLTLAVLDFLYWNNIAGGIFNSIMSAGGFNFFAQLLKRRKVHRYDYRDSSTRNQRRAASIEDEKFTLRGKAAASA